MSSIRTFFYKHKILSAVIVVILLVAGYSIYKRVSGSNAITRYVVAAAEKKTIIATVTGTGQVSASNQVEVKPKVSGDIVAVGVNDGQYVQAGALIARIDSAQAQISLENSRIALEKLKKPADADALLQAQNSLSDAIDAKKKASDDLAKSYDDGLTAVVNAFIDLPTTLTGVNDILNDSNNSPYLTDNALLRSDTAQGYKQTALKSYERAKVLFDKNNLDYQKVNRNSASSSIEQLINETNQTSQAMVQAVKDTNAAVQYVINYTNSNARSSQMTTDSNNLSSWTTKMNSHINDLTSVLNTIKTDHITLDGSDRNITEKTAALIKLKNGADPLDLQSQELDVRQKELALEDYNIRAPFTGTIANLNAHIGDSVSGSTVIGTMITKQKIANISLNEVDVAKVKMGDKATLTFDAIDGLSITGQVVAMDQVGTVSQGVVSYNVKVGFDTDDVRVKPGMSVSADIATDVHQDVLSVPNGAIKTQGSGYYVQVVGKSVPLTSGNQGAVLANLPTNVPVQIGIADDASTEIISGLSEGDKVVTRTITPNTTTQTSQAPSLLGGGNVRVGGGGNRAVGR